MDCEPFVVCMFGFYVSIISSGVSRLSDIERAFEILGTDGVTLLHCITSYPAPKTNTICV